MRSVRILLLFLILPLGPGARAFSSRSAPARADAAPTLKVLTLNVWHGLRSGESKTRFPGEDAELGYDEIHKVASCGIHLGKILKIPRNVNEGIAILARAKLKLRRVGKKRLSGNASCSATWGFQTKESRYALFGEITVEGRRVLLATTHLPSDHFAILAVLRLVGPVDR